jgi:UDP-N-acetylglucosamine 2-epimerase (non-hydrolysing)
MAPVYRALERVPGIDPLLLVTGQHQEQLDHALSIFGLTATANLRVMTVRQQLPELIERILPEAARHLREMRATYVLVQGDTLSTFAIAWAAFLERIPVGHVEAGLRSYDTREPFPEEVNRCLTAVVADLHFAPTRLARENLLHEGKKPESIFVTGQTGVDALLFAAGQGTLPDGLPPGPYVTVTLHRRENWPRLEQLAGVIRRAADQNPDVTFVYPVHLNPIVREAVWPVLGDVENVFLLEPLEYGSMIALMEASRLIVTDSGGLQEEGTTLGVPVMIVRNVTERPEGIDQGTLHLVGTDGDELLEMISIALTAGRESVSRMSLSTNPYGDGRASERIARAVAWRLGLGSRPADWEGPEIAEMTEPGSRLHV